MAPSMLANGNSTRPDVHSLFIRNLRCEASIGVHHFEKGRTQRIAVDICVQVDAAERSIDDRLENVLDYSVIRQGVLDIVANGHIQLVETLCEQIAAHCFSMPAIRMVHISIGKLDAFDDCAAVGCELTRYRAR